jgi:hypothetical protein
MNLHHRSYFQLPHTFSKLRQSQIEAMRLVFLMVRPLSVLGSLENSLALSSQENSLALE